MNLLLIFSIIILGFDLYNSVTYSFMLMAYAETAALLILMTTYLLSRRSLPFMPAAYLLVGTVAFMSVFSLTVEGYGKESALFWSASLPIYIFLLLGTYRGLRVSALILAGIVWSTANAYYRWVESIFEFDVLIQMTLGYTAITLSVYYFEKMRRSYEVQLSKALQERETLLRELNLREIVGLRGVWGELSEANRLLSSPANIPLRAPDERIYWEYSFGVGNIFKIFRIDFNFRGNYLGLPDARAFSVTGAFGFHF